jgi:hypothetical protein
MDDASKASLVPEIHRTAELRLSHSENKLEVQGPRRNP